MKKYDVDFEQAAEDDLATIWMAAVDRTAVTNACAVLEAALENDPLSVGESRESSVRRIAFEPPLGIEFEVVEDDKRVIVDSVFRVA